MNNALPARELRGGDSFLQTTELQDIKLVIGLGNPGSRFAGTRHNVGFAVLDMLAENFQLNFREKHEMAVAEWSALPERRVFLLKPQTYMNNSGRILHHFSAAGIKPEQILVVHDELERKLGSVSLKFAGSAKGHNGLKSIINAVGEGFWRLRIGIDRPEDRSTVPDYVLSKFVSSEKSLIQKALQQAADFFVSAI